MTAIEAWCFITRTISFNRRYLKGWEKKHNMNNPNVLSIKRKSVIGAPITFPFPELAPPTAQGEDTLKVVSWENPQSTCTYKASCRAIHTETNYTFTLQKSTAEQDSLVLWNKPRHYIYIKHIIFYVKKFKKWPVSAHAKVGGPKSHSPPKTLCSTSKIYDGTLFQCKPIGLSAKRTI